MISFANLNILIFYFKAVFYLSRIIGVLLVGVFQALFGCFLASATSPDGFETKPKNILIVRLKKLTSLEQIFR